MIRSIGSVCTSSKTMGVGFPSSPLLTVPLRPPTDHHAVHISHTFLKNMVLWCYCPKLLFTSIVCYIKKIFLIACLICFSVPGKKRYYFFFYFYFKRFKVRLLIDRRNLFESCLHSVYTKTVFFIHVIGTWGEYLN